jgi:hypothetical protein
VSSYLLPSALTPSENLLIDLHEMSLRCSNKRFTEFKTLLKIGYHYRTLHTKTYMLVSRLERNSLNIYVFIGVKNVSKRR